MPVLYDSVAIVPAPLVAISEQKQTAPDGTNLGSVFNITLKGTLVAVPPGTTPVPIEARLGVLLEKQKFLSNLFSNHGRTLEVYSPDGTGVTKCNPVVKSIDIPEDIWVQKSEYTITLEAPSFYGDVSDNGTVYDISDNWQIEESGITTSPSITDIRPVWRLTHTVSAKGRVVYNELGIIDSDGVAWKQARNWVIDRLSTSNFNTKPFNTDNELNLVAGGQGYNHTRTESVDVVDGSFSITETWILAYGITATEDYNIQVKQTPEDQVNTTVTISGTIRGLSTSLNGVNDRINNALNYFNTSVKNNLIVRARAVVPNVTLSDLGTTGSLDYNYAEGTISYSYDFNDKPTVSGNNLVYDTYTVSKKTSIDTVETVVTIQGTITGRLEIGEYDSSLLRFERAKAYWDIISSNGALLTRVNKSGVGGLKASPLNSNADFNFFEGSITYSYEFDNRQYDLARNEYTTTVRSSREEGRTVVALEGSITGLRNKDTDPPSTKYNNALAFWLTWEPQVFAKVSSFVLGASLNPEPNSRSRGDNSYTGVINYSFEYNTDIIPTLPDALSEQISISDTDPSDVFALIPVLGRQAGPILQDIGSKTERNRSISLEVVMKPGKDKPTNSDLVINLYKPSVSNIFVARDESSWQPNTLRYTRNVTWVYEI